MEKSFISRRSFLSLTSAAAVLLAPLTGSKFLNSWAFAKKKPFDPVTLDLNSGEYSALTKAGGVLKIPHPQNKKTSIFMARMAEDRVAAYSSKCAHLGCELPLPVNNVITCPCHKATYDIQGKVTKGPAKKDLVSFEAILQGTTIVIRETAK
jgi:Rieske Fe-S protein